MKQLIIILMFFLSLFRLNATTYYVSTTGSNTNFGTLSSPFATPNYAALQCVSGDVIDIRGGTYNLTASIRLQHSNLTIRSHTNEWAILNAPVNDVNIGTCIYIQNPGDSGFIIERLEIIGGYYYGIKTESNFDGTVAGYPNIGTTNIVIKNCKIHDTGRDCIKVTPACNNVKILNCEIYNSGIGPANSGNPNAEGIDNVNGDDMQVFGCYIHNISTNGLYLKGGAANGIIENNLITNCGSGGILLGFWNTDVETFDPSNTLYYENINGIVRNNIVLNCQYEGIGLYAAKNAKILNNTIVNCAIAGRGALFLGQGEVYTATQQINPPTTDITIQNNIFQMLPSSTRPLVEVRKQNGVSMAGTNIMNYNKFFTSGSSSSFRWYDNILSLATWQSTTGFDAIGSSFENPSLNSNYHLNITSTCIDAGFNTLNNVAIDYDGQPRISTDIGADEYNASAFLTVPPASDVIGTGVIINSNLGINEFVNLKRQIKVFPTYTNSVVYVSFPDAYTETCLVINSIGKIVKTKSINTNDNIDLSDLSSGIYILKFSQSKQNIRIVKY